MSNYCFADDINRGRLNIEEEDGSPSVFPYKLKVTNNTLTDGNDGTATLNISSGTTTPAGANFSIQYNNSGSFGGLPLGSNGQYLVRDTSNATGYNWSTPAGSGNTTAEGFDLDQVLWGLTTTGIKGSSKFTYNSTLELLTSPNITSPGNIQAATYGSDASVSNAELLYVGDVTSAIQAQLDGKAALATVYPTTVQRAGVLIGNNSILNFNNGTGLAWGITNDTVGNKVNITLTLTESDPAVTTHEATYNHPNYDTAYGWGDHSTQGYLTNASTLSGDVTGTPNATVITDANVDHNSTGNYSSTRHFVQADISITNSQISDFTAGVDENVNVTKGVTAEGWGDHALAGYAADADLTTHTGNTTIHVTAANKSAWDSKQAGDADLTSLAGGITGIVKGAGDGGGYAAAGAGTDYLAPSGTGAALTAFPWGNLTGKPVVFPVTVQNSSALAGNNSIINFIAGQNVTLTVVNDTVGNRVNVTINAIDTQGAGGGGGGALFREYTLLPSSAILDDNSPPAISIAESTGTGTARFRYAGFDGATAEIVYWTLSVPSDYNTSGTMTADVYWYTNNITAGNNCTFNMSVSSTTAADADDMLEQATGAPNTAVGAVDTNEATRLIKTTITMTNNDSIAAGDVATFRFWRDAAAATDTAADDANVVGVHLKLPRT